MNGSSKDMSLQYGDVINASINLQNNSEAKNREETNHIAPAIGRPELSFNIFKK